MKIAVVGTGYVGLVSGACFADVGNDVICVDVDDRKIDRLRRGEIPIYEPGLEELVERNTDSGHLVFTTNIKQAVEKSEVCLIAVGTPMGEDGSADLHYVLEVAADIGRYMTGHRYVIDKSTVPVGTAVQVRKTIQSELDTRGCGFTFDVISNPEFLKEGTAVKDCMRPDRVVIGTDNRKAQEVMKSIYSPFVKKAETVIFMDIASAEMTKYTANAMLATKISFMNEISNICELTGADVNKVRVGIGSDRRIGNHFIYPGCGYGGSCFPKDVQALIRTSSGLGYSPRILQAVEDVNKDQKRVIPKKITNRFGPNLQGFTFAIWGLAFKPDTDDMRQSASIVIIEELTKLGARIQAYDPKAEKEAQSCYLKNNKKITYFHDKYEALHGCHAMILVTEWQEFSAPDFDRMKRLMDKPIIFDGRNQYEAGELKGLGFEYYQIGVGGASGKELRI